MICSRKPSRHKPSEKPPNLWKQTILKAASLGKSPKHCSQKLTSLQRHQAKDCQVFRIRDVRRRVVPWVSPFDAIIVRTTCQSSVIDSMRRSVRSNRARMPHYSNGGKLTEGSRSNRHCASATPSWAWYRRGIPNLLRGLRNPWRSNRLRCAFDRTGTSDQSVSVLGGHHRHTLGDKPNCPRQCRPDAGQASVNSADECVTVEDINAEHSL